MESPMSVITLGVKELERPLAFYHGELGLLTAGIVGTEFEGGAVVFFHMNDNLTLALYPRAALAKDAKIPNGPPNAAMLSIGHYAGPREEVDAIMWRVEKAGGTSPATRLTGSGEDIVGISRIRMVIYGNLPGTLHGKSRNRDSYPKMTAHLHILHYPTTDTYVSATLLDGHLPRAKIKLWRE